MAYGRALIAPGVALPFAHASMGLDATLAQGALRLERVQAPLPGGAWDALRRCHHALDHPGGPALEVFEAQGGSLIQVSYAGVSARWRRDESVLGWWPRGPAQVELSHIVERVLAPLHLMTTCPGLLALHGSAVRSAQGQAVVFIGGSGAGKSTSAYELARMPGAALMADDLVLVDVERGLVLPGAPTLRLWRQALPEAVSQAPVSLAMDKQWFQLPEAWAVLQPCPLGGIFALERDGRAPVGGQGQPLRGLEALTSLLAQCFDWDEPWAAWASARMGAAARLASQGWVTRWRFAPSASGHPEHLEGLAHLARLEASAGERWAQETASSPRGPGDDVMSEP